MTGLVVGAISALAALVAAFFAGRRGARKGAALKQAEEYAETRRRIDNAEVPMGDDDLRKWLRNRDPRD